MRWPEVIDEEDYDLIAKDEDALGPGVRALLADAGVAAEPVRYPTGSLPVYAAGDLALKLYPPVYLEERPVEAGVLSAVHGRLPIPTPGVHRTGDFEGWGYVLMDRMPGRPLIETWDEVDRDRLADRLGETIAALREIPPPEIDEWWPEDWAEFVEEQRAGCEMRHRALGLDDEWVAKIEPFLDSVDLGSGSPVLLHTEIMRVHLLTGASGEPTGLIDFEPAVRGSAEYEYAAVGAYVSQGDAGFLRRVLLAAGYRPADLTADLRRRLMAWLMLHYYSNIAQYFVHLPAPPEPTFESLADTWFATD